MISSYRVGLAAGSAAFNGNTLPVHQNVMRLAQESLAKRKQLGIAHYVPEQDFLRGFVEGYEQHTEKPDGLCLEESKHWATRSTIRTDMPIHKALLLMMAQI